MHKPTAAHISDARLERLEQAWQTALANLRSQRNSQEHWHGELSTSALSTATAISGLAQVCKADCVPLSKRGQVEEAIQTACQWLGHQQNDDGGFGDTNRSHSNIATTLLVLAAWELANQIDSNRPTSTIDTTSAWQYIERQGKWDGLRRRYGKDKTFVVPILSNCALAGMVAWREVPPLPFEMAWLPQELYRWMRLPVVSYAVPALVAIGQARFHFLPPKNPLQRAVRRRAIGPTLRVLRKMQPASGGYLEATPLTSFVLMSLAAVGQGHLPVAQDCLRFLLAARLPDGSWPIDTNLATWVTSLSIHALAQRGKIQLPTAAARALTPSLQTSPAAAATDSETSIAPTPAARSAATAVDSSLADSAGATEGHPLVTARTIRWLLSCQHRRRHPFTGANPGGWGWTDLSGAVPDADDTPAALIALSHIDWSDPSWQRLEQHALESAALGLGWLLRLQNRDGGWPTFCRGWGTLPFDRSGSDLTAHALRALHVWLPQVDRLRAAGHGLSSDRPVPRGRTIRAAMHRGLDYLAQTQQADGSWLPLWFGNQDRPDEGNPVYGTGKVLLAYGSLGLKQTPPAERAARFLAEQQNSDGGWGGGESVQYAGLSSDRSSTIEETAVALEGLLYGGQIPSDASIMHGLDWLAQAIQSGNLNRSWPIGFYFAKLWYHERLYPTIFSLGALGAALNAAKLQMTNDPQTQLPG